MLSSAAVASWLSVLPALAGSFLLGFFGALFLGRFCGRLRGLCRCCLLRLRLELFLFGAQGLDECPGSFGVELFAVLFPGRGGFLLGGSLPLGFLGVGFLFRVVVGGGLRHHAPPSLVRMFFGIAKGGAHLMVWRPPPVWVGSSRVERSVPVIGGAPLCGLASCRCWG